MPSRGNRHISSSRSRTKRFVDRVDFDLYCCLCRRHRLIVVRFVTRVSQQAKLWVQVIRQLRNGVKLKASGVGESARKPIEYELTPYEMMMDDIRSRRYKLRQVMVDGVIPPRVKKDAHAVILEFIRSRPPLRKVFITFSFFLFLFFVCFCLVRRATHSSLQLIPCQFYFVFSGIGEEAEATGPSHFHAGRVAHGIDPSARLERAATYPMSHGGQDRWVTQRGSASAYWIHVCCHD